MKKITYKQLEKMDPGTIFAKGVLPDGKSGINMMGTGMDLLWIACRGDIADWAIYCGPANMTALYVKESGDKVHNRANIEHCVNVDDEMMQHYRY